MTSNGAFVPKLSNVQNNDMVLYDSSIGQWKNIPVSLAPSVLPTIPSGSILANSSNIAATAAAVTNADLRSKLVSNIFIFLRVVLIVILEQIHPTHFSLLLRL